MPHDQRFSDVFRWYQKRSVVWNGLKFYSVNKTSTKIFKFNTRDIGIIHPLSTYAKFLEKVTILTPWYAHVQVSFSKNFAHVLNGWSHYQFLTSLRTSVYTFLEALNLILMSVILIKCNPNENKPRQVLLVLLLYSRSNHTAKKHDSDWYVNNKRMW